MIGFLSLSLSVSQHRQFLLLCNVFLHRNTVLYLLLSVILPVSSLISSSIVCILNTHFVNSYINTFVYLLRTFLAHCFVHILALTFAFIFSLSFAYIFISFFCIHLISFFCIHLISFFCVHFYLFLFTYIFFLCLSPEQHNCSHEIVWVKNRVRMDHLNLENEIDREIKLTVMNK